MKEGPINFYSDTQTRPTSAMWQAMTSAALGDEQLGLDPSVQALCTYVADLLSKEEAVAEVAKAKGLLIHMDGARLFNAVVAAGVSARAFAAPFDSVWIDLTKGLGCPVGAVLAGSSTFIHEAWRWKQRLGGAMRQAGFLAAAGLHALTHHVERLAEDHDHARLFGTLVSGYEGVRLVHQDVETNIVFLDVSEAGVSAYDIRTRLEGRGINIGAHSPTLLRAVTHLDVSRAQIEEAAAAFVDVVKAGG